MKVPLLEERVIKGTPSIEPIRTPNITMPRVIPDAFGANVGAAYENLGAAVGKIAGHIQKMAIDEQDKEVMKRETASRLETQNYLTNNEDETIQINGQDVTRKKGFLLRPLGQAKGATQEFDQIYQTQLRTKYMKGLSKYQATKLGPALDNYYASTRNNVITHEANQLDEDFKNATESNIKQKIMDASLIRDEKQLVLAIEDAKVTIEPYNRRYDKATQAIQNEKVSKEIAESSILAAIEQTGNYPQAKIMLEGIKNKISPATYADLSNKIGQRAVDMAIAQDMSIRQEDSVVMKELQKGKKGAFGYLPTTELNKAIKESQQKIFYNSQIKQRDIKDQQVVRNDEIVKKISDYTLTLADIEREMEIPEEQGGLPKKTLVNYKEGIQRGIKATLDWELKQTTTGVPAGTKGAGEPTDAAKRVRQYLNLIDAFTDDKTDQWLAREMLSEAYKDGIANPTELKLLNTLKKNLKDIEFNRSTGPIVNTIKGLNSFLKKNNANDEDIAIRIKQLLKSPSIDAETSKKIGQNYIWEKVPESQTFSEKGQLMMDGNGNLAMVYPDGTIEPYIKQPRTKKEESAPQEKK